MKIYTRTGDAGETGLFAGPRVRKDSPRIEAYGTVDELNAQLGVVRQLATPVDQGIERLVADIQNDLFDLGAQLASPTGKAGRGVTTGQIEALERAIDQYEGRLDPLSDFILPGGSPAAAALHVARTVCRRAERRVVELSGAAGESVAPEAIAYLNRLSDLLFVLARTANRLSGTADVAWQKR